MNIILIFHPVRLECFAFNVPLLSLILFACNLRLNCFLDVLSLKRSGYFYNRGPFFYYLNSFNYYDTQNSTNGVIEPRSKKTWNTHCLLIAVTKAACHPTNAPHLECHRPKVWTFTNSNIHHNNMPYKSKHTKISCML